MSGPLPPRGCFGCHVVKAADDFDLGPTGKRRKGVCRECEAERERERVEAIRRWRTTYVDEAGRTVRRCPACREVKPLTFENFTRTNKPGSAGFNFECRVCAAKRLAGPPIDSLPWAEQERVRALWRRRKNRQAPATRERALRRAREYAAKVQRDPAKRAQRNEAARMRYRLRKMEQGEPSPTKRVRNTSLTVDREEVGYLPAAPLLAAIERLVVNDHLRIVGDDQSHAEAVCGRLGIDSRNLRRWRSGGASVQADVVDRVLTRAGWHWWDVYGDEPVEVRVRAAALLAGGQVAV